MGEWVEAIKQCTAEMISPEVAERKLCRTGMGEHISPCDKAKALYKRDLIMLLILRPHGSLESGIKPRFGGGWQVEVGLK